MEGISMKEWMAILAQDTPATPAKESVAGGDQNNTSTITTESGTSISGVADPTTDGGQEQRPGIDPLWMFALMGLVFYFLMIRPNQKKQKAQKEMLNAVKKHDKIKTIGGIFGTVLDVKDDFVVIKIDETNNTKMHISRSAIGTVLVDDDKK